MSKLDELIDQMSAGFVKPDKPKQEDDPEKLKEKEFFFKEMQTEHRHGECRKCGRPMRIHLSTFVCEPCESRPKRKETPDETK